MTRYYKRMFVRTLSIALLVGLVAPNTEPAEPSARQRHVDRLAILVEEHKVVSRQLAEAKTENPQDTAKIRAAEDNLDALNREIAHVSKQPAYEDKSGLSTGKATPVEESIASPSENISYDGWDVFKNFGRKANATTAQ